MVIDAYKTAFRVLLKKPLVLWGLSLMCGLLTFLINSFGVLLPIISIPITLTLSAGMSLIYLDGLKGKEVNSDQLFAGFKKFAHVAGGMAWMSLWVLIWSLIPFVGIITGLVKAYSYAFVPYILMTCPDISATEALRISMRTTNGKKLNMFLADLLFGVAIFAIILVLFLVGLIPVLGWIVCFGGIVIIIAFSPLLKGLIGAYFYETRHAVPPVYGREAYADVYPGAAKYPDAFSGAAYPSAPPESRASYPSDPVPPTDAYASRPSGLQQGGNL